MEEQWEEPRGVGGQVLLGSSPEHPWCASLQPPMAEGTGPLDCLAQPRCPGKLHRPHRAQAAPGQRERRWLPASLELLVRHVCPRIGFSAAIASSAAADLGPGILQGGLWTGLEVQPGVSKGIRLPGSSVFKSGGMLPRARLKPAEFLAASPGRAVVPPRFLATSRVRIGWVLCVLGGLASGIWRPDWGGLGVRVPTELPASGPALGQPPPNPAGADVLQRENQGHPGPHGAPAHPCLSRLQTGEELGSRCECVDRATPMALVLPPRHPAWGQRRRRGCCSALQSSRGRAPRPPSSLGSAEWLKSFPL